MKKILLSIVLISISYKIALASSNEKLLNEQINIQQRLEQQRQNEFREKEIQEINKVKRSRDFKKEEENNDNILTDDKKCIKFKIINIKNSKIYSENYLKRKFLEGYEDRCLGKKAIKDMQSGIMNFYIKKGYSNTRVYFDFTKVSENILDIYVEEGIINEVFIETSPKKDLSKFQENRLNLQKFFAFPFKRNKIFNLKDFEQGLDQMNRLQSNDAKLEVKPTENSGYSDIIIKNKKTKSTSIFGNYDNSGNESTGKNKISASISQDNLLSVNDNIYFKYTEDTEPNSDEKYSKSYYTSLSIPFGYWTFNTSFSKSEYLTTVSGATKDFHSSGNTITQNYSLDKVLFRTNFFKTTLGSTLEIRDSKNYINDTLIDTGSRKSSNIGFYVNNIIYTKFGTIMIKPSYFKGMKWFDAKKDEDDLLDINPKMQYDLVKLYVYYNTQFRIPLLTKTNYIDKINGSKKSLRNKIPIIYTLTLDSQYSFDTLYSIDQISIGGQYTIRGFKENTISGDIGYYLRNDIKINSYYLIPQTIKSMSFMRYNGIFSSSLNDILSKSFISIFYDYGFVKNRYKIEPDLYNSNSGYMSGVGASIRYYGKYLNASFTYSKALQSPSYLYKRDLSKKENNNIYFDVGLVF